MSKLCKDVRLPMATGTGPCNPVFDRFKATIEMAFRSQVTKVQLARQGSVPGTHETGTSPFQSLTTSNKKSPSAGVAYEQMQYKGLMRINSSNET